MVARSSAKVEFRAMALGICELIWLKRLPGELHVTTTDPMLLYSETK